MGYSIAKKVKNANIEKSTELAKANSALTFKPELFLLYRTNANQNICPWRECVVRKNVDLFTVAVETNKDFFLDSVRVGPGTSHSE